MKKFLVLMLALALLGGVCCGEAAYDLSTASLVVFQTINGVYRTLDFQGHFVGENSESFPSDRIDSVAVSMEHGEFGYVAADGTTLVPAQFAEVPVFEGDYAVVCARDYETTNDLDTFSGAVDFSFPFMYGVIDRYGSFVVPLEYDYADICGDGQYAVVSEYTGETREGLVDLTTGEMLIEPSYWSIYDVHDGAVVVTVATENPNPGNDSGEEYEYKSGLLSLDGQELLPICYDNISYMEAVHAFVVTDGDTETAYRIVDGRAEIME